ncbi:MAG: NADH-quinone oxidoreductase subunit M, partial [Cytophagaceae bacterium]
LIPAYFLCSAWGGERRIAVTFKFFIYTFVGSLLMLVGILYVYFQTNTHSFAIADIYNVRLSGSQQNFAFCMFFIAFAIKMPIFPFHTWQPDTYEQSPTAVTMVLSAVMVKMGMFAVLRWLLPVVPDGVAFWSETVIILSIIGIVYASCLAIVQTDLKRLVACESGARKGRWRFCSRCFK